MVWSYNAGTTTPNLAGLVEFNGVRLNDGSYTLTSLGGLDSSPGVRGTAAPLPSDDGGTPLTPFYDPREFTLEGYLEVTTLSDIWAAKDYLRGAFNLNNTGLQTLVFNTSGWTARRQVSARIAGPVQFDEPTMLEKLDLRRDFQIPMVAPDPRAYNADTLQSVTVGTTATALTNNGNIPTFFTVAFAGGTGGWSNPSLIRDSDSAKIEFNTFSIAAGATWTVTTNPSAAGGITVTDNTGGNHYGNLTAFTARTIAVGSGNWHVGGTPGAGATCTVTFRDAWA